VRAAEALPLDTVIDGEIVIADADGSSDFGALQQRLGVGRRDAGRSAQQTPAVLLAFDVLRREGADLTNRPLRDRRASLECLLAANTGCLQLIAQTDAVEEAEDWLRLVPNIEGIVAKRCDGRYLPGQRDWVKVKRRRTVDCVVIGIAGDHTRPWLVLGLRHADGQLHHLGLARPSKACSVRSLRQFWPRLDLRRARSDLDGSTLLYRPGIASRRPRCVRWRTPSLICW
jgi:ATP-dependent DNA ligase